jgi:hypothetical protein
LEMAKLGAQRSTLEAITARVVMNSACRSRCTI